MVFYCLLYGIDRFDNASKSASRILVPLHQRCTSKSNLTSIGQYTIHLNSQLFILATMSLINQNKDVRICQWLFDFLDGCCKLIDDGCNDGICITFQQLHQFDASCGILHILTAFAEGLGDLCIQVCTVCH